MAILDLEVTESPQAGFYLAYLLAGDGSGVYLSLMQGATEVLAQVGRKNYLGVLRMRSEEAGRALTLDHSQRASAPLSLPGRGWRTHGYNAGSVAAIWYPPQQLQEARLIADLEEYLGLYRRLVDLKILSGELRGTEQLPAGLESGQYRLITSPERNRSLAKRVKAHLGSVCSICGFDFEARYGELGRGYIEAHHLTPMRAIKGRPTNLTVHDFAVVCSNCHRMLHQRVPPFRPGELRSRLEGA